MRTYGNWRRSRGIGLLGLGAGQTILVVATLTAVIVTASISPAAFAVAIGPGIAVVIAATAQWDGIPLGRAIAQRLRWALAARRGWTSARTGHMADHAGAWELPGLLAATDLVSIEDPTGDFGLVWHRRSGMMTATLRCSASSTWLVDAEQAEAWVGNWDAWMASLGYLPMVRWVAVTVDTAPRDRHRVAADLTGRIDPAAPAASRRILTQLAAAAGETTAQVETRVSITFDPGASPARPKGFDEAVAEIRQTLPGLETALGACGLIVRGRASADYLAAVVRSAFDPAARSAVHAHLDTPEAQQWASAGPVAAEELPDRYQHEGATSVSWSWHEAPRQQVPSNVLARLLAPGRFDKRVTLLFRPYGAAEAAGVVESEVNAAQFRSDLRRARKLDVNARERVDGDRARSAAAEEATGAGVCRVGLWVSTTVADEADLGRAVADVEQRAEVCKVRLRRAWRSQAAAFATTLPAGICPPQLASQWPR